MKQRKGSGGRREIGREVDWKREGHRRGKQEDKERERGEGEAGR